MISSRDVMAVYFSKIQKKSFTDQITNREENNHDDDDDDVHGSVYFTEEKKRNREAEENKKYRLSFHIWCIFFR